jgi:hypothetical protein
MDVETCWKWFNEVFLPEVKKRTEHQLFLLLDNAPGHFEAFERNNVRIVFFPQIAQVGNNPTIWA